MVSDGEGVPLSPTCTSSLWVWPGGALFVGAPLPLGMHSGAIACLILPLDGVVDVQVADEPAGTVRGAGSVLVPPRVRHQVTSRCSRELFLFLDGHAGGRELSGATVSTNGPLRRDHHREGALREAAGALIERRSDTAVGRVVALAADRPLAAEGSELATLVQSLRAGPGSAVSDAETAAAELGRSTSWLLHAFPRETGTTLRRLRLWGLLIAAAKAVGEGADLTTAAHTAGFASSAHLSTAFRRTFGVSPSLLREPAVAVHVLEDDPRPSAPATSPHRPALAAERGATSRGSGEVGEVSPEARSRVDL